jgi:hypothetical protein
MYVYMYKHIYVYVYIHIYIPDAHPWMPNATWKQHTIGANCTILNCISSSEENTEPTYPLNKDTKPTCIRNNHNWDMYYLN